MTKQAHEAAAKAHRKARANGTSTGAKANRDADAAYTATWDATQGNHPDHVQEALEATGDSERASAIHDLLASWHDQQADTPE